MAVPQSQAGSLKVRRVSPEDKERLLSSFKPLFGDWDYLPLVIDDWLTPSADKITWVAEKDSMLVAMGQAARLEQGDWYLNGLRSNPRATPLEIGSAIMGMRRAIRKELASQDARRLRYGTLPWNKESLRMGALFGFREHFRLGHSHHSLPSIPAEEKAIPVRRAEDPEKLFDYLKRALDSAYGHFFTWWDTRKLRLEHLEQACRAGLLLETLKEKKLTGAAMFWHIPWQKFLVLSVMEGDDDALSALYGEGVKSARELGCIELGLVHPSMEELHRRQALFGLEVTGSETVQLIYEVE